MGPLCRAQLPLHQSHRLVTQRNKRREPLPGAQQPPGTGGLVLLLQGPLLGAGLCLPSPRALPARPALLVLAGSLASPKLSTWALTAPGMWRGSLSEVRKRRAGLPPPSDGARGGSSVGNKSE